VGVRSEHVEELHPGLWTWTAPHPDWHEQPLVRSYAVERGGTLVLIDPMAPPAELLEGEVQVALTCPWHGRSAHELGAREAEVESRPGFYPDERVLWLADHRALVFGDAFPGRPVPDEWLGDQTRDDYRSWLTGLLELPVELTLPTHGDPGGRDLLEQALVS
jgi:hypothetical protein